ncbi:hypothetical protein CKO25_01385 [Thiocapsa imhoffii]|uniref:PPi-type phosphoenolpyruvate carboxykinase lobe 2 domain-containing protein n=1 Tax=Thiocapsa imhoffii TaxID=382777 RepID=A0A9X0WFQ4_9GAMM|nr:hypothetical protein [Thiocapsa imhoffii]
MLTPEDRQKLHLYINFKLISSGQSACGTAGTAEFIEIAHDLLSSYREKNRLLANYLCPVDRRIQDFLQHYLDDLEWERIPALPHQTFILDRHGLARELSVPIDRDAFHSNIISSYRVAQGVLNNPASDRRTTAGSFHIAEGGLPIPGDKKAVPKIVFARLLQAALNPPEDLLVIPFTADQEQPARMFVSLLLRPPICPEIPGIQPEKNMEIRFFAPGNLVSNLDFVESIFGNGGNPYLADFDAALDVDHWSGHTGCVLLAPHLTTLTKQELGLPHWDQATERQRTDGMCWRDPAERYNDGTPFKLTARDASGVIFTLITDNYYGYCKKEVKTQISFAANLYGMAEEEHAGGALAFPRFNHGEEFGVDPATREPGYDFADTVARFGELMELQPQGYGIDKRYPQVIYVPQDLRMDLRTQRIAWTQDGVAQSIRLQPNRIYVQPNGYKIEMQKHPGAPSWRLIGTKPEGTFCHKPCTVSGGGKSEISKSLDDAVLYGPIFVDDLSQDLDRVEEICARDYTDRFRPGFEHEDHDAGRKILSSERSLGSVIKLLTPSPSHTWEYNTWLHSIPPRLLALVFMIKRFYQPSWGDAWRKHFSVDEIDGAPGHELKVFGRRIVASYLRVGFDQAEKWRTFKLRQDFIAAEKIQMEDDITTSVVVPPAQVPGRHPTPPETEHSIKLIRNCEYRLFQRPDDAIIPGFDKQTERELAQHGNFMANYEPLGGPALAAILEDVPTLSTFTAPMRQRLEQAARDQVLVVSSAHPKLVNGQPTKNPRYLQIRPDLVNPVRKYVAEIGARFHRKLPLQIPLATPVDAVLVGRRNNPPEPGIRPLAVYNPIHYQELPELFMDFVCSLTGKSPSTTGAGSEGALTKAPFNALNPTADLNNALVSFILTGFAGFSSSAGHIGTNVRVAHDISLLIPEIWARLTEQERDPGYLIENGYLEALEDFEYDGRTVLASRLGYRITDRFVAHFMGKIFDNPSAVFTEAILRPESQDLAVFVDGIENICEAQQRVARRYLEDGSIAEACPPLAALIHIMAEGHDHGRTIQDPAIRGLFTREALMSSDWYRERLEVKQQRDLQLANRLVLNLQQFLDLRHYADEAARLDATTRLQRAQDQLARVRDPAYLESLVGTIGADPLQPARSVQPAAQREAA